MKSLLLVYFLLIVYCSISKADDKKGPKVTDKVNKLATPVFNSNRCMNKEFISCIKYIEIKYNKRNIICD